MCFTVKKNLKIPMEDPDRQLELSLDVTSCYHPTEPAQKSSVVLAQHRLADQETRTKQNAQLQDYPAAATHFLTRHKICTLEKTSIFDKWSRREYWLSSHGRINKTVSLSLIPIKINSKWIKDLKARSETLKQPEKTQGECFRKHA